MNETECSTNLCATVAVAYDEMIDVLFLLRA